MTKQMSWECSSKQYLFFLLVLLITPTFLVSMEQMDLLEEEVTGSYDSKDNAVNKPENVEEETFGGYLIDDLNRAFESGSYKYKALYKKLANEEYMRRKQLKGHFFVGVQGTGKTTSAIALAYKLKDKFTYQVINCPAIVGKVRGEAVNNLKEKIKKGLEKEPGNKKRSLLIFDEAEDLFERADDNHYDTASTTRYIICALNDSMLDNKKHFIFILNKWETFSEPLLSRMRGNTVEFDTIHGTKGKVTLFEKCLEEKGVLDYEDFEADFLKNQLKELKDWSVRDFEALASEVVDQYLKVNDDLESISISKKQLIRAIKIVDKEIQCQKTRPKIMTDFEQREKHHQESMKMQQTLTTASLTTQLEMHKETLTNQDKAIRSNVALHPVGFIKAIFDSENAYDVFGNKLD